MNKLLLIAYLCATTTNEPKHNLYVSVNQDNLDMVVGATVKDLRMLQVLPLKFEVDGAYRIDDHMNWSLNEYLVTTNTWLETLTVYKNRIIVKYCVRNWNIQSGSTR